MNSPKQPVDYYSLWMSSGKKKEEDEEEDQDYYTNWMKGTRKPVPEGGKSRINVGEVVKDTVKGALWKEPFKTIVGAGEAALSTASAIPAGAAGLLAQVGGTVADQIGHAVRGETTSPESAFKGLGEREELKHKVAGALTYQPRTQSGQALTEVVAAPFNMYGQAVDWLSKQASDDPDIQAALRTLSEGALWVLIPKIGAMAKARRSAAATRQAVDTAIRDAARKTEVAQAEGVAYEARRGEVLGRRQARQAESQAMKDLPTQGQVDDMLGGLGARKPPQAAPKPGSVEAFIDDLPEIKTPDPLPAGAGKTGIKPANQEIAGKMRKHYDDLEAAAKIEPVPSPSAAPPTRPPVTPRPKTRAEAMVDELLENKVPIDPIRDTTVLPTPGKSTAPVTAREAQGLMWADDLPAKGLGHAHLAIENPVWIFEKFPALKGIYEKAKEATFVRNEWLNEVRATTKKLRKGVDQDAIGRYAIAQQKGGKKLLDSMGMKVRELTPREMEVYVGIRNEYNKTFVRINRAREIAGLDPVKFTHDYSTWLRMFDKADDLGLNFSKDPAAAIHNAYEQASTMFFHPKAPGFRFGIKRARSKIPVNTRFLDVFDLYMDRASRHVVYAPAVAKARNIMRANPKSIPEGMVDPKVARRFDTVAERLPVLNTWLEGWTDFLAGSSPRVRTIGLRDLDKAARVVSKNTAAAVLSYNLRSAIIQPSSLRNTYLALGEVNTLRGIADNLSPSLRKFAMENSQVLKPRAGSGGDVHIADISSRLRVEGKRGRQAAVELGIAPLKFLDIEAARATWLGAWRRGLKLDLKGKDLYSFADDIVTKTQASALPQDIVPLQRSGVGKTMSLFNTFVIGEWNLLRHGLLKEGVYLGGPNNAATAMRFLWATAAFNALMEDGIGVRSPFPTPERALAQGIKGGGSVPEVAGNVVKELAEQLPIVGQTIRYADPTWGSRMPAVPQLGMDLVKLFAKSWGILEGKKSITTQDIRTVGTALGIPGTSQLAKYVARRKAGMSHLDAIVGVVPDKDEKKSGGYK